MAQVVLYSLQGARGEGATFQVGVDGVLVFSSHGVGPDNLSWSPLSGSYTVDGHELTCYVIPPTTTTSKFRFKVTGPSQYALDIQINSEGTTTSDGYRWSASYEWTDPQPSGPSAFVTKRAVVSIVNTAGEELESVGEYFFRIYKGNVNQQASSSGIGLDQTKTYLSSYKGVNYEDLAGFFLYNKEPNLVPTYVLLKTLAENLDFINTSPYNQYFNNSYIRLTFDNGFYLQGSFGYYGSSSWNGYYDDGTLYVSSTYFVTANDGYYPPLVSEITDGLLSGYIGTLGIRVSNGGFWISGSSPVTNQKALDFYNSIPNYQEPAPPGPTPGEDPYTKGGVTEEGGGEGDFDDTSEDVPVPTLPNLTVDNTGFISLFNPSMTELRALASYLWDENGLDLETFKRIFADPISAVLGLTIVPVTPTLGGSSEVILGNVRTGVSMARVSSQYVRFDCGTINVNEYWGGYMDYSPYTSAEIYLPYIGTKPINTDDIMGKSVHLVYNIDLLSGACCAHIECSGSVLYQFIGQCACSVPITGQDMTRMLNGILSVVGAGAGTFVSTGGNVAQTAGAVVGSLASSVMGSKQRVEKSGSMGSMGGMLGVRSPYLILTRPRQALPAQQSRFTGYPSYITSVIAGFTGYTVFAEVHLSGLSATDAEKQEIEALMKTGVIL